MSAGADVTGRPGDPSANPRSRWILGSPALLLLGALGYWMVSALMSPAAAGPVAAPATGGQPAQSGSPAHHVSTAVPVDTEATASAKRFTALTGIQVLRVAVSGDGGILDLRYRVLDGKTTSFHKKHQAVPAIIDGVSGRALTTQWMGHAGHPLDSVREDRNYWMLFLNPGELVKSGDRVSVRLGHVRLTGVTVV